MGRTKSEAQVAKDEFIARLNAEFGGVQEWGAMKQDVASQTGGDTVYIQKDLLATGLSREGYLITPHIGRTRFSVKLQPEDIGLDPKNPAHGEFIDRYLALGSKLLLPASILRDLDQIEGRIRRTVEDRYGIPTCMGTFVPYKNIEKMKAEVEELKREYFTLRDKIVDNYETLREETEAAYRKFAPEVFRLLKKSPTDEDIKKFVQSVMSHFPTKEQVHASFYVKLDVGVVMTTAFLAEQETRLRLAREREQKYKEELALIERQLTEDSRVQAERERQRLLVEREIAKTKIMEERSKQKAIQEAIAQAREEYLPQMEQVFADLAGAVHGIVYDTLTRVTEAIKTNGSLRPADTRSLNSLLEKIRSLAFTPDPDVERWLLKIESIVETPAQKRNMEDVREALDGIREQAAKVILALGRAPRTLRGADLPDIEIALEEMTTGTRQKRQLELDIADSEEQPLVRAARKIPA